jgi:oligogalacturonide transporter
MGVMFGISFALPFIWTFFATRERPEFQRPLPPINLRETFVEPFRVRSFVTVLLMYLLAFVAMDAVASIVIYYMKYYLGRGGEANYVSGTLLVMQVASLPFYVWLSRRTSKKTGYLVGAGVWMLTMLTSFLIVPGGPAWAVYVFAAFVGIGTGGIVIMIYAIFPDIPDIDELKTGQRREGIYSALITFMRKFSSAIAIFIVSQTLALSGYLPPVETVVGGVTQIVEQPNRRPLSWRCGSSLLPRRWYSWGWRWLRRRSTACRPRCTSCSTASWRPAVETPRMVQRSKQKRSGCAGC